MTTRPIRRRVQTGTPPDAPVVYEASDPRGVIDPSVAIARPDPTKPYPEENPIYIPPGEGGGEGGDVPSLDSIVPPSAALGDPSFTLHVLGAGFTPDSVIVWNGGIEPTTVVSETELTTGVDMSTAQVVVQIPVLVRNASGDSNTILFDFTPGPATQQTRRHGR